MKVDIYDFDKTIYDGDSSIDFFMFSLRKRCSIIFNVPKIVIYYVLYFLKIKSKKEVKEIFFEFLNRIDDVDLLIKEFWSVNKNKIKKFYLDKKNHDKDIIISASPEFLLKPICQEFKVYDLIASDVDKNSGKFLGENCKGIEKVIRLKDKYKNIKVNNVYTDSYSDQPLIDIANSAYIVRGDDIEKIKW